MLEAIDMGYSLCGELLIQQSVVLSGELNVSLGLGMLFCFLGLNLMV